MVIVSFRSKGLEEIYLTGKTRRTGAVYLREVYPDTTGAGCGQATEEMNVPGFRYHGLQGEPQRWSVRVTGNYRITFGWSGENAEGADFEDYH